MINFHGRNADDLWINVINAFKEIPDEQIVDSRGGLTKEFLHVGLTIDQPQDRWVFSRTPPINPAFALVEVFWILSGRNDSKIINFFNPQYPKYAGYHEQYHGAYGHRIRKNFDFDQLKNAYASLKSSPENRQIVLQIWDTKKDFPKTNGQARSEDIPCNICSMIKIRDNKLEWMQIMRSNDLMLGLPYNIVQFTFLQEILAGWLNIETGRYCHLSDSLHVYEKHFKRITEANNLNLDFEIPDLKLPLKQSEQTIRNISKWIDNSVEQTSGDKIIQSIEKLKVSENYKDLARIIGCEILRRKGIFDKMLQLSKDVQIPAINFLWKQWARSQDDYHDDFEYDNK